ncbi:MAG: L,D-transpeptidase ErfK/SrfK [Thermoleophilaceae bacterium]|nr:L,D-transpeptidase ErfK/SrfK [Thermoleophilaceae bacterium]
MRQRSFIALATLLAVLILGAVAVYAYDSTRDDKIAKGVSAGGVDLGGLKPAAARTALERQLADPLRRPVVVTYSGKRYKLSARQAGVRVDTSAMVAEAVARTREGNIVSRTARAITGGSVNARIPVNVTYSRDAVNGLVTRVKKDVDRPARDARLAFSGEGISRVEAQDGRLLKAGRLRRELEAELTEPTADRRVSAHVTRTRAKVTANQLADKYPTVITVSRGARRLRLYKHLSLVKTYPIAVGQVGLETPAGMYTIQDKQVDPAWHVPNSAWAGALAGKVIPGGVPENPLRARWMGIYNGAGIHGTSDVGSLGSAASHGCIRMAVPDVEDLYDRVNVGNPVYIS